MSVEGLFFLLAAFICFAVGLAHSIFGERWLANTLIPNINALQDDRDIVRIIRTVWHLLTIIYWAIATLFFLMSQSPLTTVAVTTVFAIMFLLTAIFTAVFSGGRFIAWTAFVILSAIAWGEVTWGEFF